MKESDATVANRVELHHCADAKSLAFLVARHWIAHMAHRPPNQQQFCVALSGGRLAGAFFQSVVEVSLARAARWNLVEFFFADDRWVPNHDEASNFRLAQHHLLEPLGIHPANIHPLYRGVSPEFDAAQAQADLLHRAPVNQEGAPVLDLVILGMGDDGHVASLFPDAPPDVVESHAVYVATASPKPPHQRITLTYAVLAAASRVIVMASGRGKEIALRDSLSSDGCTPLARLLRRRHSTTLMTDIDIGRGHI